MAPAGKQKSETQGPTPAPPLLECAVSKDSDLAHVLPWTAPESNKHGRTLIWPNIATKWPSSKAIYPFFLHSIFVGLVPPFSIFFTAILNHYGNQALHVQPNSILLMPLWDYQAGDDELRLRSQDLPTKDLNTVVAILLGGEPGDLLEALGPLYHLDDLADLIAMLPVFDEQGLFPAEGSGPVEVSSDDTSDGEDSEKTVEDGPASPPPPSKDILLRKHEDDDATCEEPADEEGEARRATSQALVAEPQKHPEAVGAAPLRKGQALEGPQSSDAPMLAISKPPSETMSLVTLPPRRHRLGQH
ncbi:hypothetical protein D1007_31755 [Hordeum vulgare]|nr:hypothetical protein D1007_31755 [Hordeum vulgare]